MATALQNSLVEPAETLISLEEFAEMQFDQRVELIDGKIRKMGNNNRTQSELVIRFGVLIEPYARPVGKFYGGDVSIIIDPDKNRTRAADLAFLSSEKVAKLGDCAGLDHAPELIIEIVSPSNTWEHVQDKIDDYFRIGVQQVWIVSPGAKKIFVHTSAIDTQGYAIEDSAEIDLSPIIPGLVISLTDVFSGIVDIEEE